MVDAVEGVLALEWITGRSVRFLLGGDAEDEEEGGEGEKSTDDDAELDQDPT